MDSQSDTDKAEAPSSLGNIPIQESTHVDAGKRTFEELCSRFIEDENIKQEDRNAVNDMHNLFQSLNDRLRNIENIMLPRGSTPPESLQAPFSALPVGNTNGATQVKPKVVSRIQKVAWDEFKSRDKNAPVFAIDVLIGHSQYWFQKKTMNRASTESGMWRSSVRASDLREDNFKEMPDRIRINSAPLLTLLDKITRIMKALEKLEIPLSPKPTSGQPVENTVAHETSKAESESFTASRPISTRSAWDSRDDAQKVEDLKYLIALIKLGVKPFLPNFENGKIRFQQLWHLFKPGDDVFLNLDALKIQESMKPKNPDSFNPPPPHGDRHGIYQIAWRILQIKGGRPMLRSEFESMPGPYMP